MALGSLRTVPPALFPDGHRPAALGSYLSWVLRQALTAIFSCRLPRGSIGSL